MAATAAALILAALVCCTRVPLGIPGEWVWPRREIRLDGICVLYFCLLPLFLVLGGIAWWAAGKLWRGKRVLALSAAMAILAGGMVFNVEIWDAGPGGRGENIMAFLDAFTGGYLTEAAHIGQPGRSFAGFAARMAADEDPGNHLDVHPPGNVFAAWAVLQSVRNVPALAGLERFWMPDDLRAELAELSRLHAFRGLPAETSAIFSAAALLLALSNLAIFLGLLCSLLAAVVLMRRRFSPAGMVLGAFFAVYACGGPVLFAGHFDTFMFFWGALASLSAALALTARSAGLRLLWAFAAGVVLAAAVSCTLAFAATVLLVGLCLWADGWHFRKNILPVAVFAAGGLLFVGVLWLFFNVNLFECVWYASRNNAAFFRETGRSVMAWWPCNLLDVLLFAGPAVVFFMLGGVHLPRRSGKRWIFRPSPRNLFITFSAGIALLLLISPFSRGEMGRLFLFFVPCCLTAALMSLNVFLRAGCSRGLLYAALLSNLFLVLVLRVSLKLVIGY